VPVWQTNSAYIVGLDVVLGAIAAGLIMKKGALNKK